MRQHWTFPPLTTTRHIQSHTGSSHLQRSRARGPHSAQQSGLWSVGRPRCPPPRWGLCKRKAWRIWFYISQENVTDDLQYFQKLRQEEGLVNLCQKSNARCQARFVIIVSTVVHSLPSSICHNFVKTITQ